MVEVIQERLTEIERLRLLRGSHDGAEAKEFCVMEAVAYVAGERHSDSPACASPVISAFMRRWNDDLDDAGRQRLKPYIPQLVGTAATPEIEQARGWMAADWLVRVHTAAWLRLAKLDAQAEALEQLPPIDSPARLDASVVSIAAARDAARDAAWDAAWAAARAAAWDAAWDAAWAAAWAAARDAARDAVSDAAWDAARDAARKHLEPTKLSLEESAFKLLDRMLAVH
jgi:hypothetical protein